MAQTVEPQRASKTAVESEGISLYVHVPFCLSKCPYCDFNTYQGIESQFGDYLAAVNGEIEAWARALAHPAVNTVFLGGGTPSYLPDGDVGRILESITQSYRVGDGAEITAECNPNDLTDAKCVELQAVGINRISMGVQSMDNGLLAMLGRRHDSEEVIEALRSCRRAGFDNVNLDLIYGLPRQTLQQWQDTVERILEQSPEHISMYSLTLEEGTPLRHWVQQGRLPEPDPDLAADMYDLARSALRDAGYHHYEISNWCRAGRESEHNLAYWRNLEWVGVGPGAHSSLGGCRFWTVKSPREYALKAAEWVARAEPWDRATAARIEGVPTVDGLEVIDEETAAAETMFLGLRLLDGMDVSAASDRIGVDLMGRYAAELEELAEDGLLVWGDDGRLRLAEEAYLVGNQVFTRFLP